MGEKTVRVGIIGNGAIAHSAHLPALSTMPGVEIAGIMGRMCRCVPTKRHLNGS